MGSVIATNLFVFMFPYFLFFILSIWNAIKAIIANMKVMIAMEALNSQYFLLRFMNQQI